MFLAYKGKAHETSQGIIVFIAPIQELVEKRVAYKSPGIRTQGCGDAVLRKTLQDAVQRQMCPICLGCAGYYRHAAGLGIVRIRLLRINKISRTAFKDH